MMTIAMLATTAFCRIVTPTTIEFAPDMLAPNLRPPTAADYFACGWLKNAILPPSPPEGYCVTNTTYEAVETRCVAVYDYAPVPPVVPTYSVARLVYFLTERGLWEHVKAALGESIILQAVAVGEFSADNEDFVEIRPAMEAAFGAEIVAAALAYADTRNTSALREMAR